MPCSSVSIVNFEQVNADWDIFCMDYHDYLKFQTIFAYLKKKYLKIPLPQIALTELDK